jgi:hypothetical protein
MRTTRDCARHESPEPLKMRIGGRVFYQLQLLIAVFSAVATASVHGLRNVRPEGTFIIPILLTLWVYYVLLFLFIR